MSESATKQGATKQERVQPPPGAAHAAALEADHGKTLISDAVVAKVAGMSTREIPGVHDMGKGMGRAMGTLRQRIGGGTQPSATQGVSVEVGQRQAAIDIDVVVEYGQSIVDVTEAIRRNVIGRVEGMTGLEVTEVNIGVDDIYVEGEGEPSPEPRVE